MITGLAVLLLVINVGTRAYVIGSLRPQVQQLRQLDEQLEALNAGLVDEETSLRGYLATGSTVFLRPYYSAQPVLSAAALRISRQVPDRLLPDFAAMRLAQQAWTRNWVRPALDPARAPTVGATTGGRLDVHELTDFLASGKVLFDTYRATHQTFEEDISRALDDADATEADWLLWSGIVQAIIAAAAVGVVYLAGRRLKRLVAAPVASLAGTVAELRAGNLGARVPVTTGAAELVSLSRDVDEMAAALQAEAARADMREREALRHSARLSLVLGVAREAAGSLSLRYVLDAVTSAACQVGCERARAWLVEEDERSVNLAFDSASGRKGQLLPRRVDVGVGSVGRAVKYGKPIGPEPSERADEVVLAVPMIIGGRVVGVLECARERSDEEAPDVLEILEALAGHAAGSVEAARLHEHTRELAVTDALTGLPNRRAFDEDIDTEVRRALRYERPLSVIYLDLDHFKALNDRYGHAYGDTALQQTATALRACLRDTDRCYRLGGEELIVVAPETTALEAVAAAERFRAAVATCAGPDAPTVTASFGVAELPSHATDATALVRAADRAVYVAKARGRNCVVLADSPTLPIRIVPLPG